MNFLLNLMMKGGKKKGKGGKCHFWLIALLLLPLSLFAQNHSVYDVLNVRALITGTNGFGITNLSGVRTNLGMVHATNVMWTNLSGTLTRSAGIDSGTNLNNTAKLFNDIPLYPDRSGQPLTYALPLASTVANSTNFIQSALTLYIELSSPRGSNAPVGINFAPLWDGENTPTATTHDWSILVAGGVGHTTIATNVPLWLWPGAEALRVRNVTNQYILGGEAAITNSAHILKLRVVGFRP